MTLHQEILIQLSSGSSRASKIASEQDLDLWQPQASETYILHKGHFDLHSFDNHQTPRGLIIEYLQKSDDKAVLSVSILRKYLLNVLRLAAVGGLERWSLSTQVLYSISTPVGTPVYEFS